MGLSFLSVCVFGECSKETLGPFFGNEIQLALCYSQNECELVVVAGLQDDACDPDTSPAVLIQDFGERKGRAQFCLQGYSAFTLKTESVIHAKIGAWVVPGNHNLIANLPINLQGRCSLIPTGTTRTIWSAPGSLRLRT